MEETTKFKVRDRRGRNRYFIDNALLRGGWGRVLGPYGIAIYDALALHADGDDQDAWPSFATLADLTGMSRRQAIREIQKLARYNLIAIEGRKTNGGLDTSNEYVLLNQAEWFSPTVSGSHSGDDSESLHAVSGSHSGGDSESPKQDSSNKTQLTKPNEYCASAQNPFSKTPLEDKGESASLDEVFGEKPERPPALPNGDIFQLYGPEIETIRLNGWKVKNIQAETALAAFRKATKLDYPADKRNRDKWVAGVNQHLETFCLDELPDLYQSAWKEYLPQIKEGRLDITWPGALTNKMQSIFNRQQLAADDPEWGNDEDENEDRVTEKDLLEIRTRLHRLGIIRVEMNDAEMRACFVENATGQKIDNQRLVELGHEHNIITG